jgi:pyruvate dehydrogenase E1 component alpha subunit
MKRIRATEEEIARRYPQGKMRCPTHLSIGQEAVAVGACAALNQDDIAISTHRAHAHYLAKGGSLRAMIAELHGKVTGCSKGRGGSMHLIDLAVGFEGSTAIVANTIPVGVGIALALSLEKSNGISCVFLGDGAIEEGAFYESANFAAVRKLPVLFICENNLYSVYSPLSVRQAAGREIYKLAAAIGLEAMQADGNDVRVVKEAVQSAVDRIRAGGGPQFIEFSTYRWREHCGPNYDNDIGYRQESEFLEWQRRDPLVLLAANLKEAGLLSDRQISEFDRRITSEIAEAFDFAEKSPFPDAKDAGRFVYKEA